MRTQWRHINMESLFMIWALLETIRSQAPSALFCILDPKRSTNNTKTISVAVVFVSALVKTNNKLNNSILWLGTVMCACGWVHTCLIMCRSKLHSCHELRRRGWNTVPRLWSSKTCFPEHFSPPSAPFYASFSPLSTGSLAAILKLEHRNTGRTRRTNSSHALWLLDSILFSTGVLEDYLKTAFLAINRANAGFHSGYLNLQREPGVCRTSGLEYHKVMSCFLFHSCRNLEEDDIKKKASY